MDLRENNAEQITIPKQEYDELRHTVVLLQQELSNLKRMLFGKKSERFIPEDPAQLSLALDPEAEIPEPIAGPATESSVRQRTKAANKREPIPEHLHREEQVIMPEQDINGLIRIGQVTTEYYEYSPGKLYVKKIIRPRYLNPETQEFFIAPIPELPIPGSNAGPGMLAHIVVSKFEDHLPFHRQSKMIKRDMGVHLPESTLNDWLSGSCRLLDPLYGVLKKQVLSGDYIQADETPIPVLTKDKPGSTHKGYQWVYHAPENKLVYFDYQKGRGREGPTAFLKSFEGALQTDAYAAYDIFERKQQVTLLGCWAHARRYFDKSMESDPERAGYAMQLIQQLYTIEREFSQSESDNRALERKQKAEVILHTLKTWLQAQLPAVLPKSPIGKAIQYTLSIWDRLTEYTNNDSWLIDNNMVENLIRPVALGRKNYMFSGSHNGAERAAMMYSFLGTCKLNGVNPLEWLTHVLTVIPSYKANKLEELLPVNFVNQS